MANGVEEDPARFKDSLRVYYLYNYINEALKGETAHMHHAAETIVCTDWTFCPLLASVELNYYTGI